MENVKTSTNRFGLHFKTSFLFKAHLKNKLLEKIECGKTFVKNNWHQTLDPV